MADNSQTYTNKELADIFVLIADLLEIKGEVVYKILAYRKAADNLVVLPRNVSDMWGEGQKLTDIPGVGKAIAEKMTELLETGQLQFLEKLKKEVPESLVLMRDVPDLGPKKIKLFWQELGITSVEALKMAAEENKLAELPGMGVKSQQKILDGIESLSRRTGRIPLGDVWLLAQAQIELLSAQEGVKNVEVAGSLRRMRETVGDVDVLVAAKDSEPVIEAFITQPSIARVLGKGETKASIEFISGLRAQIWVHPPDKFGTALQYATGSKDHNVRLRELALSQGYSLSEHGMKSEDGEELLFSTEDELYKKLGLPWIPPELREDRGEIQAAKAKSLPQLVETKDIIADLHAHTTWSDGSATILEMAQVAISRGYQTLAITDHSASLGIGNGLSVERLEAQKKKVVAARKKLGDKILLLHGTEMEIRADGSLDFPDEVLAGLDFVIASLHVSIRQPKEQITKRMLGAITNPHVDMIAHPTNRLIPDREGADLDMDVVLEAAAKHDVVLEINANPRRLDLNDVYARRALELGIKVAINTDAHGPDQFGLINFGVGMARRAWASPEQIVNTWKPARIRSWLSKRK